MTTPGRRRRVTIAAGIVVAAAVLAIAVAVLPGYLGARAGTPATPAVVTSPTASVSAQAVQVAAALRQLATHPDRLLPSSLSGTVQPTTAVPSGTEVAPLASSWVATGPRSGTMQVALTGAAGTTTDYLAVMVQEDGSWRVLETEPLR